MTRFSLLPLLVALLALVTSTAAQDRTSVETEVCPERLVWERGETIKGVIRIRNTGTTQITLRPYQVNGVQAFDERGREAGYYPPRMYICGASQHAQPAFVIEVGKSHEEGFEIFTDPLGMTGGRHLLPGSWELRAPCPIYDTGLIRKVTIEVLAGPENRYGRRVVDMKGSRGRVALVRENGRVEVFDAKTGDLLGWASVPDFDRGPSYLPSYVLADDGSAFARVRESFEQGCVVEVFETGPEGGKQTSVPILGGWPYIAPKAFSPDGSTIILNRGHGGMCLLDWRTGKTRDYGALAERQFSPDGRFMAECNRGVFTLSSVAGGDSTTHRPDPFADTMLAGVRGLYVSPGEGGPGSWVEFIPYDGGEHKRIRTGVAGLAGEMADGRLLITSSGSSLPFEFTGDPGTHEVWDFQNERLLWSLRGGKPRKAVVTGVPSEIAFIGVLRGDRFVTWLDETLEVFDAASGALLRTQKLSAE